MAKQQTLDNFEDEFGFFRAARKAIRKYGLEAVRAYYLNDLRDGYGDYGRGELLDEIMWMLTEGVQIGVNELDEDELAEEVSNHIAILAQHEDEGDEQNFGQRWLAGIREFVARQKGG